MASITEKYIIDTYLSLFENLSPISKMELLERLKKSLKRRQQDKDKDFFASFGAFGSEKSAEEIIKDIKEK